MFLGFCCLYLKFFLEIVRFESREFVMQVHSGVDLRGGEQMLTNYPVFTHQCDQNPRAENLLADSRDQLASAITPITIVLNMCRRNTKSSCKAQNHCPL